MFLLTPILKFLHVILGLDTPHKFPPPLTAEEEAQFDDWMDGNSITDRKTWR